MVFRTIVTGAYKPTYILGVSHCTIIIHYHHSNEHQHQRTFAPRYAIKNSSDSRGPSIPRPPIGGLGPSEKMVMDGAGTPRIHLLITGWWCNNHLEKYDFVNGKDDIPFMKWKIKKCLKPPTRSSFSR